MIDNAIHKIYNYAQNIVFILFAPILDLATLDLLERVKKLEKKYCKYQNIVIRCA